MSDKSGVSEQIISLPKGGGELKGLGEKFQPDLHMGTGNFSIPISIPSGRNGFQPHLSLSYSTGSSNGSFGLGWSLGIPSISRKTSKGIPKYQDSYDKDGEPIFSQYEDIFVFSGADDLVYTENGMYRPRTEGIFAIIRKQKIADSTIDTPNPNNDNIPQFSWQVVSKDGITNRYGQTSNSQIFVTEDGMTKICTWLLSETEDTFKNRILYTYKLDTGEDIQTQLSTSRFDIGNDGKNSLFYPEEKNHRYNQVYLQSIEYVNYNDGISSTDEKFLYKVEFDYGQFGDVDENGIVQETGKWDTRTDRFSSYRTGFEVRTARLCKRILIERRLEGPENQYQLIKSYNLKYAQDEFTGISILKEITVTGFKKIELPQGSGKSNSIITESFAPIEFDYTKFEPQKRRYEPFAAEQNYFPEKSLSDPNYEIIDLFGDSLPCIIHSSADEWRCWRNLGNTQFAIPKPMQRSPAGVLLANKGVQFADMNGDGSVDLLVSEADQLAENGLAGYYSSKVENSTANWAEFHKYIQSPSFDLKDPNVKLVDMDGDGVIDVLSTTSDETFLFIRNVNHSAELRFEAPISINRKHDLDNWPDVFLGSPDQRIRLADMSGDGLQDIVMIHSGRIDYWPNLGYGKFGKRITMFNSPIFRSRGNNSSYDPKNLFLTDVNGDGLADLVYVDAGKVSLWINQSGNRWSQELVIYGTPTPTNIDSVRIADMKGTGTAGVLWSHDYASEISGNKNYKYLDFTGGTKPMLLNRIDNNIGSQTIVEYRPSTFYYLNDKNNRQPWKTTLPFPIQVVSRVESIDFISKSKLTSEYFYHHGQWDGLEREFCGFGRVDQRDSQEFSSETQSTGQENESFFSPSTELRTWFHQGPIKYNSADWKELDYSDEFTDLDYQIVLSRPRTMIDFLEKIPLRAKHDAIQTLRGRVLRTEFYAIDSTDLQPRPYTVTEYLYGVLPLPIGDLWPDQPQKWQLRVFFPHILEERSTQWERGVDPQSNFRFISRYDKYGQAQSQISIAVPRGRNFLQMVDNSEPYLATVTYTVYASNDDAQTYIVDKVASVTAYEIINSGTDSIFDLLNKIEEGLMDKRVLHQTLNFYDGPAFEGSPFSKIGNYGALVKTESLILTDEIIERSYQGEENNDNDNNKTPLIPPYLSTKGSYPWTDDYPQEFRTQMPDLAGYKYRDSTDIDTRYLFTRGWSSTGNSNNKGNLMQPFDISINTRTGDVYVTDAGNESGSNSCIQRFDSKGNFIESIAKNKLAAPVGIAVNSSTGDVYVGEATENKIRKYFKVGDSWDFIEWIVPQYPEDPFPNNMPRLYGSLAIDSSGNVYVADWGADRIQKFDSNGKYITRWGSNGRQVAGQFIHPTGIAVDSSDNVYVTDGNSLQKFSSNGVPLYRIDRSDPKPPWGVTVDAKGSIYETYNNTINNNNKVQKYASNGSTLISSWGASGKSEGQFGDNVGPFGIDVNSSTGEVYVVDKGNRRVQVFSPEYKSGYFAITERRKYDFHDNEFARGLLKESLDPLGYKTTISYDIPFDIVPVQVTNSLGLTTRVTYNYDTLQPEDVTDLNGNRTHYEFTPSGLLKSISVMGRIDENVGDTIDKPGTTFVYNLDTFLQQQRPISIHTIRRVSHANDIVVETNQQEEKLETIEFSDGFGRIVQTRTLTDPIRFEDAGLPPDQSIPVGDAVGIASTDIQVLVSGYQRYDNKGRIIQKYEPFFSSGLDFEFEPQYGESVNMYYDPRGRLSETIDPDGAKHQIVFGIPQDLSNPDGPFVPTPWETYTYDANDNSGRTHPIESQTYHDHYNTPTNIVVDPLGRKVKVVERNGDKESDRHITTYSYDIEGNLLSVIDPMQRLVLIHNYDLSIKARVLRIEQLDGSIKRTISDAAGNIIEQRDRRGSLILHSFDILNRPTATWARDISKEPVSLRQYIIYGDNQNDSAKSWEEASVLNLLGKVYKQYDESGLITFEPDPAVPNSKPYDFKGNILEKVRQVISNAILMTPFDTQSENETRWQVQPYRIDWTPPAGSTLEVLATKILDSASFRTSLRYDGINRIKSIIYPKDVDGVRKNLDAYYNLSGLLRKIDFDGSTYIEYIAYNAREQRILIAYGNKMMTRNRYDGKTFRLTRCRTEFYSKKDVFTYHPSGGLLQDIVYKYDLVGNILTMLDRAPNCGIPNSFLGKDKLDRTFVYDPIYRLVNASGREYSYDFSQIPPLWSDEIHAMDITLARAYTQVYQYDDVGNIILLNHQSDGMGFRRSFNFSVDNNRLLSVNAGDVNYKYNYDQNGNLIDETSTRHFEWDHSGRMRSFRTQVASSEPSLYGQYLYDSSGQRVKKFVRKQGGRDLEEVIYIDKIFEYHRIQHANSISENNILNIMDNEKRIATVRVGEPFDNDSTPPIKYELADHIGSVNNIVDDKGIWINQEEYTPYGETSFGSYLRKRFRFAGKERDEESGFYYHGSRYYAPWICRWISCDPLGASDGINLYQYARNRPLVLTDSTGKAPEQTGGGGGSSSKPELHGTVRYRDKVSNQNSLGHNVQKDHILAQEKIRMMRTDPEGNLHYNPNKDLTVLEETGKAFGTDPAKPHTQKTFHHPQSDVKEIARLKKEGIKSISGDIVEPSRNASLGSGYKEKSVDTAILDQLNNLHSSETLAESGAEAKRLGGISEVIIEEMPEAPLVQEIKAGATTATSSINKLATVGKVLAKGMDIVGKGLAIGGAGMSGLEIGGGINKVAQGKVSEGLTDMTSGGSNLGINLSLTAAVEAGKISAGNAALVGIAAGGSVVLAAETVRSALKGQDTPIDVMDSYYGTHFGDIYGWVTGAYSKR